MKNLTDSDRDEIDLVALHYIPQDAPEGYVPCKIFGDGNCHPRNTKFSFVFKHQK